MRLTTTFSASVLAGCLAMVPSPMVGGSLLAGGLFVAFSPAAWAATITARPFTPKAFSASQAEGKPILVEIDASWCPTCAKQRPIIQQLMNAPEFRNLVVYRVDFDRQKDVVRQMGARMQSTLVVFHGRTEEGRSVGDTNEASIRALLEKAKG